MNDDDILFGEDTFDPIAFAQATLNAVTFALLTIARDAASNLETFEDNAIALADNLSDIALRDKDNADIAKRMRGAYLLEYATTLAQLTGIFTDSNSWEKRPPA